MYLLELNEKVVKDFNKIPLKARSKIWEKIQLLKEDPRPSGTRKLIERENEYRIRYGDHRVIYKVEDSPSNRIIIIQVGHRKDIYK